LCKVLQSGRRESVARPVEAAKSFVMDLRNNSKKLLLSPGSGFVKQGYPYFFK
jgi:hypothetical protein